MTAAISSCGTYRYRLERHGLAGAGAVAWIMVNPSTADATNDDATIRKVIGFTERLGGGWAIVGNKFAFRATWGPLGKLPPQLRKRWTTVCLLAREAGAQLMCLGTAQDGQPRHPLMLAYDTPIEPWKAPR